MGSDCVRINARLCVPLAEIRFAFSRSGGPGGQHVNRSQTRVELRFDVQRSPSLDQAQRERLLKGLAGWIDRAGALRLVAQEHRSQARNRQAVLRRFQRLLREALKPEKPRRPTRPSAGARRRRLEAKRARGKRKLQRRQVRPWEV